MKNAPVLHLAVQLWLTLKRVDPFALVDMDTVLN